ncbi:MAG: ThiF family adenylyltransferase, partial [Archangium sp.]|nr:ThiF family adenylyltransferase [Archangium sp.]
MNRSRSHDSDASPAEACCESPRFSSTCFTRARRSSFAATTGSLARSGLPTDAKAVTTPLVRPASVAIVGVGGLGCPVSLSLARAGVERMTLIDADVVDVTNLHRQPWHHPADVGTPKVESAARKLRAQFPSLAVATRREFVTAANVEQLFLEHELVVDATDGVGTKVLLSDAAVLTKRPAV